MDDGLENTALISLFTGEGWCGNVLLTDPVGSDFERKCNQPITRTSLNEIRNAAERALVNPLFGKVTVTVSNPKSYHLIITIVIEPPGKSATTLQLFRSGGPWYFQTVDPAYVKAYNAPPTAPGSYGLLDQDFVLDESILL